LKLTQKNKVILTRAGDAYRTIGNYDEAVKYYTKALEIDFDIYAAIGLALICKGQGKLDEAVDRFKNLIRNDPRNSRLYVDLAECYSLMNRRDEAIKLLEDYLHNDGKNIQIRNLLERLRR